jgi:serine/threonine protein kinase
MDPPQYEPTFDGAEWPGEYRPGGFHPIMPGDHIRNERYRIVHKLGNGGNSTVWLAHDLQVGKLVALKIGTASSSGVIESEIAALRALESSQITPRVLEDFQIEGPNGVHPCDTMTVGANSLAAAKQYDMFPLVVARAMGARLASIVKSLHNQGCCHGVEAFQFHSSDDIR